MPLPPLFTVTETATSEVRYLPLPILQAPAMPTAMQVVPLLDAREMIYSPRDPDTERNTMPAEWTMSWPLRPDQQAGHQTNAQLRSLVTGWRMKGSTLVFSGLDLLDLTDEPLWLVADGAAAGIRLTSAYPWWDSADTPVVKRAGSVWSASNYTVVSNGGYLDLAASGATTYLYTVTVGRSPQVRCTDCQLSPVLG